MTEVDGLLPVVVLPHRALLHGGAVLLAGEHTYVTEDDALSLRDAGVVRLTVFDQMNRDKAKRPRRTKASS